MTNTDNERQAFEKWAKSRDWPLDLELYEEGYGSSITEYAWQGWLARAKAGGGVDGWRSIESAPGGDVDFQAWFKADDPRYESYWHARCKLGPDGRVYEYGRVDFDMDDYEVRYGYTATHWMPLPSPPKEDGE